MPNAFTPLGTGKMIVLVSGTGVECILRSSPFITAGDNSYSRQKIRAIAGMVISKEQASQLAAISMSSGQKRPVVTSA